MKKISKIMIIIIIGMFILMLGSTNSHAIAIHKYVKVSKYKHTHFEWDSKKWAYVYFSKEDHKFKLLEKNKKDCTKRKYKCKKCGYKKTYKTKHNFSRFAKIIENPSGEGTVNGKSLLYDYKKRYPCKNKNCKVNKVEYYNYRR